LSAILIAPMLTLFTEEKCVWTPHG